MRIRPEIITSPKTFEDYIGGSATRLQEMARNVNGHKGLRVHLVANNQSHWVHVSWSHQTGKLNSVLITSVLHDGTNRIYPLNFIFK